MTRADIDKVLEQYPTLGEFGFAVQERGQPKDEYQAKLAGERERLRNRLDALTKAEAWIRTNMRPAQRMNNQRSSCGLKQVTEVDTGDIPNGVFIATAIHCGYKCRQMGFGPNAEFNMQEGAIKAREHENARRKRLAR